MSENPTNRYVPTVVSPPGSTIADLLEERGISQAELAASIGVTPVIVSELVAGTVAVTPGTALALEGALGIPADFWLARDARYQDPQS